MTADRRTPAQLYALLFGALLVAVGVLGFVSDATFGSGGEVDGTDFIVFEVNGWHNLVHLVSGALGLAVAASPAGSRAFALGFGSVYAVVTLWGFIDGDSVFALIPVNTADNLLHLGIALAGLAAGAVSSRAPAGERAAAGG